MGAVSEWIHQHEINWGQWAKEQQPGRGRMDYLWQIGGGLRRQPSFEIQILGDTNVELKQFKEGRWMRRVNLGETEEGGRNYDLARFWVEDPRDKQTMWFFEIRENQESGKQQINISRQFLNRGTSEPGREGLEELKDSLADCKGAFVGDMLAVARGERRFDFGATLHMIRETIKLADSGSGENELVLLDVLGELDGLIWVTSPVDA